MEQQGLHRRHRLPEPVRPARLHLQQGLTGPKQDKSRPVDVKSAADRPTTTGLAASHVGTRLTRRGSLSGLCVEQATPLRCDDTERDERVDRAACRRIGLRSMVVVPLLDAGDCQGVLKVLGEQPGAFGPETVEVLQALAGFIALSLRLADSYVARSHEARHDALTGLPNRAELTRTLQEWLHRRGRRSLSLFFVDLDGFKELNDTDGHQAGDHALREVARALVDTVRQDDLVARRGGDEFVVVCRGLRRPSLDVLAARLDEAVVAAARGRLRGASIGIAVAAPLDTVDSLLARADAAMYDVKSARRAALV